ncbi:hypothetical protein GCM10009834_03040 [Streptomonospora arabica]
MISSSAQENGRECIACPAEFAVNGAVDSPVSHGRESAAFAAARAGIPRAAARGARAGGGFGAAAGAGSARTSADPVSPGRAEVRTVAARPPGSRTGTR